MAVASETESEPANAPPFGVIVGVLTVIFFEPFSVIVELVGERLVVFDTVLAVAVTVVELVDVLVSVFNDCA